MSSDGEIVLEVKNLKKYFPIKSGFLRRTIGAVKAVNDISFAIRSGETLGLVGESGCGKTTTGRLIVRALDPTDGEITFVRDGKTVDVHSLEKRELHAMRRYVQMIFQDPYSSLNPRMTVLDIVSEPLLAHGMRSGRELEARVHDLLQRVGLNPHFMKRYPHAFSGGQRQRIGIARALALNPELVVADEPVSALDVSVQAQILGLLQDLQAESKLSYLFIAHDLGVVQYISDRVAVMYVGQLVESAETDELFYNPKHPYTEALLSAAPVPDPLAKKTRLVLPGEVANPANPPSGCIFHPRCRYAKDICKVEVPVLEEVSTDHWAACHFSRELSLEGAPDEPK